MYVFLKKVISPIKAQEHVIVIDNGSCEQMILNKTPLTVRFTYLYKPHICWRILLQTKCKVSREQIYSLVYTINKFPYGGSVDAWSE